MTDLLSRLPDRAQLIESIDGHLSAAGGQDKLLGLLVIRVLRQEKINREYGFEAVTRVLGEVAGRVDKIRRGSDSLGRLSGTDFGLVLPALMGVGQAILAAQKIIRISAQRISLGGHGMKPGISVGIAMFPEHADTAEDLLRFADRAATAAEDAVDGYEVFSGSDDITAQRSLTMEGELDQAIQNGAIELHYQPQIDLRTLQYTGMEALARWQSPTMGMVRSDTFIDLAEKTGLMQPLTLLILNVALREFNDIQQRAPASTMSLNLSAAILHEQDLLDLILRALDVWDIRPERLMLEITETAVMSDMASSLRTLGRLSAAGIRITMDDFGTGQSSMRYLKSLPLSELKIDKSFVMNMMDNEDDVKIVHAIIDLAHNFDLQVVAEGIEDQGSLSRLAELGCEYGQGFHIGKPMPIRELAAWIDKNVQD